MHFITGNAGKFAEIAALIPGLQQANFDLPEIQSTDAKEIIAAKLLAAESHNLGEYIVEDTGLYLDCLGGLPGPLIKWFQEKMGISGIADLAARYENQSAQAVTWIGHHSASGEVSYVQGSVSGKIVTPRGTGFGWDPIFQPDGFEKTFGEMTMEEKSEISMRRLAVEELLKVL